MRRVLLALAMAGSAVVAPLAGAAPCYAQGEGTNSARIVIEAGEDSATFCLSFDETAITGLEALQRLDLQVVAEDRGAGQVTVCRIGAIGCAHPDEPCFCECPGTGTCTFWGYYRVDGGQWRFSEVGAAASEVRNGSVEGWRYGPQSTEGSNAPRAGYEGPCTQMGDAGFIASLRADRSDVGSPVGLVAMLALVAAGLLVLVAVARRRRGSG